MLHACLKSSKSELFLFECWCIFTVSVEVTKTCFSRSPNTASNWPAFSRYSRLGGSRTTKSEIRSVRCWPEHVYGNAARIPTGFIDLWPSRIANALLNHRIRTNLSSRRLSFSHLTCARDHHRLPEPMRVIQVPLTLHAMVTALSLRTLNNAAQRKRSAEINVFNGNS